MINSIIGRRRFLKGAGIAAAMTAVSGLPAAAASPAINTSFFGNLAVDGYDVLSYWQQGDPVKGSKEFSHDYMGATWLFASDDNLQAFRDDPEKYAPKYGGYCAYAASQGYVADADPFAWDIVEDRLYLNYSKSIRERWRQDIPGHIASADATWPGPLSN